VHEASPILLSWTFGQETLPNEVFQSAATKLIWAVG
jgi:hypothetical protein